MKSRPKFEVKFSVRRKTAEHLLWSFRSQLDIADNPIVIARIKTFLAGFTLGKTRATIRLPFDTKLLLSLETWLRESGHHGAGYQVALAVERLVREISKARQMSLVEQVGWFLAD